MQAAHKPLRVIQTRQTVSAVTCTVTWEEFPSLTHSLTHCCVWPARAVVTSTTSDAALMTTASRLFIRDPLPPVVSRSSLAGQVDASSRGQGICPARGRHSAGGCCGLAHLVVGGITQTENLLTIKRGLDVNFLFANDSTQSQYASHRQLRSAKSSAFGDINRQQMNPNKFA